MVRNDAGGFRAGQRVAAMPVIGGFAETVAVDADMVFPLPDDVPFEKGGAAAELPDDALRRLRRAELKRGETVLVHGAAGGVGTAACQLAAAHGARVIAVVSTPEKGEVARAAGAHEIVLVDGFRDGVRRLTDGRGVDVVVDPVGGDRFTDSLRPRPRGPAGHPRLYRPGDPHGQGQSAVADQHHGDGGCLKGVLADRAGIRRPAVARPLAGAGRRDRPADRFGSGWSRPPRRSRDRPPSGRKGARPHPGTDGSPMS